MSKVYRLTNITLTFFIILSISCESEKGSHSVLEDQLIGNWLSYQSNAYSVLFNYEQGFTLKPNYKYTNILLTGDDRITFNKEELGEWRIIEGGKDTLQFERNGILNYEILELNDSVLEIRDFANHDNHYILNKTNQ